LHRKKEKAQSLKIFVKDEGVRGRRKKLFPKSFVFSPVYLCVADRRVYVLFVDAAAVGAVVCDPVFRGVQ